MHNRTVGQKLTRLALLIIKFIAGLYLTAMLGVLLGNIILAFLTMLGIVSCIKVTAHTLTHVPSLLKRTFVQMWGRL
jgi:hypothetical protein